MSMSITQVLENGSDLCVKNLGTFKQKATAARTGRNPKTGEVLQVMAITTVTFSATSKSNYSIKQNNIMALTTTGKYHHLCIYVSFYL